MGARMRRTLGFLLAVLITFSACIAHATDGMARDLSAECTFHVVANGWMVERLTDRDYSSRWRGENGGNRLEIRSPEPIYGLYVCWRDEPPAFRLEAFISGAWQEVVAHPAGEKVHVLYPVDGHKRVRLVAEQRNSKRFAMSEIFVLSEGTPPPWVQQWQDPLPKAELMVIFAHPDDEVLWMGGTLPRYAGQEQRDVVTVLMTKPTELRRSELLNSLWTCGVRNYPVIAPFYDRYSGRLVTAYKYVEQKKLDAYVTELYRKYKPEVVVSHDVKGEYGHGMHMAVAIAALDNVAHAMNPKRHAASYKEYGTWLVSKVYLHLYPENSFDMDWDIPLPAFDGKTGFEVAQDAWACHQSQYHIQDFFVMPRDHEYSCYKFGLAFTNVGPDINCNDFFENIPE